MFQLSSLVVVPNMNARASDEELQEAIRVWGSAMEAQGGVREEYVMGSRTVYYWLSFGAPMLNWLSWAATASACGSRYALEVGSLEGRSAVSLLAAGATFLDHIDCVDLGRMAGHPVHGTAREVLLLNNLPKRSQLYIGSSQIVLPMLSGLNVNRGRKYALAYIDGSHHADDVLLDAEYVFRMLEVGGVMIFDDYRYWSDPNDDSQAESALAPRRGIHAFMLLHGDQLEELGKPAEDYGQQIAFRKVAASAACAITAEHPLGASGLYPSDFDECALRFPPIPKPKIVDADVTPVNIIMSHQTLEVMRAGALVPFDVAAQAIHGTSDVARGLSDILGQHPEPAVRGFGNMVLGMSGWGKAIARGIGGVADWGVGRRKHGHYKK